MFRKSTLLALVAAAVFGASMLVTADADARGHGGGGGGFSRGGGHSMGRSMGGMRSMGRGFNRGGLHRGFNRGFHRPGRFVRHPGRFNRHRFAHFHRHHCWWKHRHHWRYYGSYGYPVYGGSYEVAPAPVAAVAAPVTKTCTCLTKEYTPEGAVLFKDVCTNEAAINPPAPQQQTELAPPQQ
jgi:hypothetical protein